MACIVRVPTDVLKQRMQVSLSSSASSSLTRSFFETLGRNGPLGLYKGFSMTIFREIPFTCIQFPLYEYFKLRVQRTDRENYTSSSIQAACCGSLAGGTYTQCICNPHILYHRKLLLKPHSNST